MVTWHLGCTAEEAPSAGAHQTDGGAVIVSFSILVMLRNVAADMDMCNGTRLFVRAALRNVLNVEVIRTGQRMYLPKLSCTSTSESGLPFILRRSGRAHVRRSADR